MASDEISQILRERDVHADAIVAAYVQAVAEIQSSAAGVVSERLHRLLTSLPDGTIQRTSGNLKVLRTLDAMLINEMEAAGLRHLIVSFVEQWESQVSYVQRLWRAMTSTMRDPLPDLKFSKAQQAAFVSEQLSAVDQLHDASTAAAIAAKSRSILSFGGLNFKNLSESIREQFALSIGNARTLADTLTTNFFRSVNAASFDTIERAPGAKPLQYVYSSSPDDAKTRPFCHRMIQKTRKAGLTRDQIDNLDNGNALSNVWLNCGGYNCRHVWLLDTRDLEAAWKAEKERRTIVPQLTVN